MDMSEILRRLGCCSEEATRARFLDDPDFYLQIVGEMLDDPAFERLLEQLGERDASAAFETAHMLKGVVANCGVTPLYEAVTLIVEPLRAGRVDFQSLEDICRQMLRLKDELKAKLNE